jgi:hypothetical protein
MLNSPCEFGLSDSFVRSMSALMCIASSSLISIVTFMASLRMSMDEIAARAGCCRRMARMALALAEELGLVHVEYRPIRGMASAGVASCQKPVSCGNIDWSSTHGQNRLAPTATSSL